MDRFIERAKLSKKARRELDAKKRVTWDFSPVSRRVESRKIYNRKKRSRGRTDDFGAGSLFVCCGVCGGRIASSLRSSQ